MAMPQMKMLKKDYCEADRRRMPHILLQFKDTAKKSDQNSTLRPDRLLGDDEEEEVAIGIASPCEDSATNGTKPRCHIERTQRKREREDNKENAAKAIVQAMRAFAPGTFLTVRQIIAEIEQAADAFKFPSRAATNNLPNYHFTYEILNNRRDLFVRRFKKPYRVEFTDLERFSADYEHAASDTPLTTNTATSGFFIINEYQNHQKRRMIYSQDGPKLLVVGRGMYNGNSYKYWSPPFVEGPCLGVVKTMKEVRKWLANVHGIHQKVSAPASSQSLPPIPDSTFQSQAGDDCPGAKLRQLSTGTMPMTLDEIGLAAKRRDRCFKVLRTPGLSKQVYGKFVEWLDLDASLDILSGVAAEHLFSADVKELVERHVINMAEQQ